MVDFGPSLHDENSYYLIRAYDSLAHRQESQDAFYGSPEWRQGPREAIIALIESDTSVVIEMEDAVVDMLRRRISTEKRVGSVGASPSTDIVVEGEAPTEPAL